MITNTLWRLGKSGNKYFAPNYKSVFEYSQKKNISFLWAWINRVFNTVDNERLKLVGPDLACAEWLLKNGATFRFKGHSHFLTDYNALIALEETLCQPASFRIEEIYAKDSAINAIGFNHFKGCNDIRKITFLFCSLVDDEAIFKLNYIEKSLHHLELTSCFNISDEGILSLTQLRNLRKLILADLVSVKNKSECKAALKKALVKCDIDFQDP